VSGEGPFGCWVWKWAEEQPDKVAIIFEDERITWAAFADRVVQRIVFLREAGRSAGERVVWLGVNTPAFIELYLACSHLGLIFVPLNSRLSSAEHRDQLDNCGPAQILCEPEFLEHMATAGAQAHVLASPKDFTGVASDVPPRGVTGGDADALIVYTSGTTGLPKGAVHTHRGLKATLANGVDCQDLNADDVALAFLPLFHVGGLNIQVLPTLAVGGTIVLHRACDPAAVIQSIEEHRTTVSVFVPATMSAVLAQPSMANADVTSMRGVMTGSSVIAPELLQAFNDLGLPAGQVYGSTETGPTAVVLRFEESAHIGAAGKPAVLSECRLVDGELQVRGPHLFNRYWDNQQATAKAFDDDWYRTGDRAFYDEDFLIRIEGRTDDMIVSGGENIFPEQIEDVLIEAPGVRDVAVIGHVHPKWGEVPVAFVVPDGDPPSLTDLRDFAATSLARFKLPAELTIVDELPRTALGKLQKFRLR